jgi:hypothetical protein
MHDMTLGMSESDPTPRPEEAAVPNPPSARQAVWRHYSPLLSKMTLELFIVFVGVSAAFAVEDYRDSREENERREAVYRALDHELRQMAETHGPVFQRQMTEQLTAWDRAVARGGKPLPPTFRLPGASGPPTGVWDAAAATGSIELVEPLLFYELGRFYNRARTAGELYRDYAESARMYVWPHLSDGPDAFWEADGDLKPELEVHLQRLRDYHERQGALGKEARILRVKLKRAAAD